jgi:hypothetical protein
MANGNLEVLLDSCYAHLRPQPFEVLAESLLSRLKQCLSFDIVGRLRRLDHRQNVELTLEPPRKGHGKVERLVRSAGTVVGTQNSVAHFVSPLTATVLGFSSDGAVAGGSRWRGMKNAFAMSVGTTALATTAAMRYEYCASVMMPCVSPKSAEMLPKVRPVDIMRVV